MSWFFEDESAVQKLRVAAAKLRDQPFVKFQQDCVWLPEQLLASAGAVESFNFPRCAADYSRHVHNDRILTFLRGKAMTGSPPRTDPASRVLASRFAELPLPEKKQISPFRFEFVFPDASTLQPFNASTRSFLPGDLLIMKSASKREDRGVWHMPVMLDDHTFIHCAYPRGVTEGDILAPNYRDILVAVFRARS